MSEKLTIEIGWALSVVRRWWWLIAGLTVLAVVVAVAVTATMEPLYESSVTLMANPSKSSTASQYNDLMAGEQLALTYSQMITDRPILDAVIAQLGLDMSTSELSKTIVAEPVSSTQLLKVKVTNPDPEQAALIANTIAQAFSTRVQELSTERYAGTLKSAQVRMNELQAQFDDDQKRADDLRSQRVTKDVLLANKQSALSTMQNDHRALQNSLQSLQLTVAEATGRVHIVEPVQAHRVPTHSNVSASAIISLGLPTSGTTPQSNERLALTYGKMMQQPTLLEGVIKELGLTETPSQLSRTIQIELVPGTQLIKMTYQSVDEAKAQNVAEAVVNAFVIQYKALLSEPYADRLASLQKQMDDITAQIDTTQTEIAALVSEIEQLVADVDRLETTLTEVRNDYRAAEQSYERVQTTAAESADAVVITEPAKIPKTATSNNFLYISLAGLVAAAIGTTLAFFLTYNDDRIRSDEDVRSAVNLPLFSRIGTLDPKTTELVVHSAPTSNEAEDFRVLGNKIRCLVEESAVHTLMVTSPAPTEGKSLIISNLAVSLSRMGLRVIIVDADLRIPRLHQLFGVSQEGGLTSMLARGGVNGTAQLTEMSDLKVITSGDLPANPAEILSSPELTRLLQQLKTKADLVLIDCPPVLAAADASIIATKVDAVLMVLRVGVSENRAAREAVEALRQVKANMVGIILNGVDARRNNYYRYYKQA